MIKISDSVNSLASVKAMESSQTNSLERASGQFRGTIVTVSDSAPLLPSSSLLSLARENSNNSKELTDRNVSLVDAPSHFPASSRLARSESLVAELSPRD